MPESSDDKKGESSRDRELRATAESSPDQKIAESSHTVTKGEEIWHFATQMATLARRALHIPTKGDKGTNWCPPDPGPAANKVNVWCPDTLEDRLARADTGCMHIEITFAALTILAMVTITGAFIYAALTSDLTGSDVSLPAARPFVLARPAAEYRLGAPVDDLDAPIQLPKLPTKPACIVAYRVPAVGAPLSLTYIHAQGV